jgi:hypothetical protein
VCRKNLLARERLSLLLEEKVSPVCTLVTDVVENVANLPEVDQTSNISPTPHQSKIGSEKPIFASFSSRRSLFLSGPDCRPL